MTQNLDEWVFSIYGQETFRPGLDRINKAISPFKAKLQKSRIITIAGTNGKGETTHRLSKYLKNDSYCTWTSPHIHQINERFSSENGDISDDDIKKLLDECHLIVQAQKLQLSYYEFLFFAFCKWAAEKSPKYILLEVGLGGRLDAVNALDANLILLTSISRDHQEFLGSRYDQILGEKLGVLRPSSHLISFLDLKYLRDKLNHQITPLKISHFDLEVFGRIPCYEFSKRNQLLAYAACCHLKGEPFDLDQWVPTSDPLFARGEVIRGKNNWFLFGSHNVDGMRKLIQLLLSANYNLSNPPYRAVVSSFSKRNEKDVRTMLKMLKLSGLGEIIVTAFDHPKAYPREDLEKLALQEGLKFVNDISSYVHGWTHQKILVAGSYYFLGQLKSLFRD
jgi:dihydrofolate synthase/folylpolyglutamate synthase